MDPKHPYTWRPPVDLFEQVEARAEEKGLSVNEWLNRCVMAGLTKGGAVTLTVRKEF